jgi:hypothetical protein
MGVGVGETEAVATSEAWQRPLSRYVPLHEGKVHGKNGK